MRADTITSEDAMWLCCPSTLKIKQNPYPALSALAAPWTNADVLLGIQVAATQ